MNEQNSNNLNDAVPQQENQQNSQPEQPFSQQNYQPQQFNQQSYQPQQNYQQGYPQQPGFPQGFSQSGSPYGHSQEYDSDPEMLKRAKNATIGLIMGLISIIAWLLPLAGYPVTIIGIVFSSKGLNSDKKGQAVAGIILSIIFLIATIINSALGAAMAANLM